MEILNVDRASEDQIIVSYSDGKSAVYSAKQLRTLEPIQTADGSELPLPLSAQPHPEAD
jgi:hypothetical protein